MHEYRAGVKRGKRGGSSDNLFHQSHGQGTLFSSIFLYVANVENGVREMQYAYTTQSEDFI